MIQIYINHQKQSYTANNNNNKRNGAIPTPSRLRDIMYALYIMCVYSRSSFPLCYEIHHSYGRAYMPCKIKKSTGANVLKIFETKKQFKFHWFASDNKFTLKDASDNKFTS